MFGSFFPQCFLIHTKKNPVDTTPTAIFRNTLFKNFSRRKLSTKITKDSLLQRRGAEKIVLFFPSKFLLMWFQSFQKKIFQKTLFTLFYSSFSGWSCCIINCLSHLENRSWFVWGYYSNNANKCTWNQYYRFTQPLFHSSWGDWWSKNLKKKDWIPF